jgi:hypothetical protein
MDAGNHGFENLLAQDQQPREDTHAGGVDAISSRAIHPVDDAVATQFCAGRIVSGSEDPALGNVMYNPYIMRRTQIYLTEEQGRLLEGRSQATGRTVSQLIREAVDAAYSRGRQQRRSEQVRLARRTAGAWTEFRETGAQYVERIRGARRLARLHRAR